MRSRALILESARAIPFEDLRLNAVARAAGLGVGTVYRHFPTVEALREAVGFEGLQEMVARARHYAMAERPGLQFFVLARELARLLVEHEGVESALIGPSPSPDTELERARLSEYCEVVLAAAIDEGLVRPEVTSIQIQHLICGLQHAVRLNGGRDRELLTSVLLDGLRPAPVDPGLS